MSVANLAEVVAGENSEADHADPPIRTELCGPDQHAETAKSIAHARTTRARFSLRRPKLFRRLAQNGRRLVEAHREIREAARAGESLTLDAEWLLDNFYVIEQALREVKNDLPRDYFRKLPMLADGPLAGWPRIYQLAGALVSLTDSALEEGRIVGFVRAYQEIAPLTIAELWAIPTMLRLALLENLRRLATQAQRTRADQREAAEWAKQVVATGEWPELPSRPRDAFFVALMKAMRDQSVELESAPKWLAPHGPLAIETLQREHQRLAANQVSVGNCVTSLRLLNVLDWSVFVEGCSAVEAILRGDPAGVHSRQDFETRDRCRRAVEELAEGSGKSETEVARLAVTVAAGSVGDRWRLVGWRLIGEGRRSFEGAIGFAPRLSERGRRLVIDRPHVVFFGLITALTAAGVWLFLPTEIPAWASIALGALLLFPASEVGVGLANFVICHLLKPRVLPKLDYKEGIGAEAPTFVVVPCMLLNAESAAALVDRLELHYLANPDPQLWFALLTDFADAETEETPRDEALLRGAIEGIRRLNDRHCPHESKRFFLFHRQRRWNESERRWMGWERKRGKLQEFFHLLRGRRDHSFIVRTGDLDDLPRIRFVLTLDADTVLPREAAAHMASVLAHPLNRATIASDGRVVEEGYAILQPRVSFLYRIGFRSWFSRFMAGTEGIDPYSRAVSDLYQDLFARGAFTGKGLLDVDAFETTAGQAFPENAILSHDLIESAHAACALASDVEVFDDFPARYLAYASREHRWVRGDWQLLPWLGRTTPSPRGPVSNALSALDRWKVFDNLRRSLVPPALLLLVVVGWMVAPAQAAPLVALVLIVSALPFIWGLLDIAGGILRGTPLRAVAHEIKTSLAAKLGQAAFNVAMLPHRSILMIDAIVRTLWRMKVSHRRLLQWESAAAAERRLKNDLVGIIRVMWPASLAAILIGAAIAFWAPSSLVVVFPFVMVWFLSPWIAYLVSQPMRIRKTALRESQRKQLRLVARRTWRFFEQFIGPEDHWLPPDNFQEDPGEKLAHRTSPTNMGLLLLSTLSAHDLGYLTLMELLDRIERTFDTFDRLEKHHGHFLNWYDTRTLAPLAPAYVSTVDSGNLLGCLLALAQGLREKKSESIPSPRALEGLQDALAHLSASLATSSTDPPPAIVALAKRLSSPPRDLPAWLHSLRELQVRLPEVSSPAPPAAETDRWRQSLALQVERRIDELLALAAAMRPLDLTQQQRPSVDTEGAATGNRTLKDWKMVSPTAADWDRRLEALAVRAEKFAGEMDFRFLYNSQRRLFSIGYNVPLGRLDGAHYDLLASEACLTSFLGIARGEIPREHWFQLGRLSTLTAGRPGLLSWGGTMFEYLMPRLLLPIMEGTLLDASQRAAVARQIEYGEEKSVPWGVSESGYHYLDAAKEYQYQAFGVPGLGLKRDLGADLVVAPYATLLATCVEPAKAIANFEALRAEDGEGPFGFYEAIDFTPERLGRGERRRVVKSYMAHHQGMGLVAVANCLTEGAMPRRLRSVPMVRAAELLLEEKVPFDAPIVEPVADESSAPHAPETVYPTLRRLTSPDTPSPRTHLLSNGRYSVMLTNAGSGFSVCGGLDVTRWRADRTTDQWGQFIYVRDLSSGVVWSAGYQPARRRPSSYEVIFSPDKAEFRRVDGDIETWMEVAVSPDRNIEIRRVTLINHGARSQTFDLTSFAEIALLGHRADVAHPAFGKLFLETEWLAGSSAILCRRRPRGDDRAPPWAFHVVAVEESAPGATSFETDRAKFLGRRRTPADPAALDPERLHLGGTSGSVLDPIFSIRRQVRLTPGARAVTTFSTGVAENRDDAVALADLYRTPQAVTHAFELAWAHSRVELRHPGITVEEANLYQRLAGHVLFPSPALRASPEVIEANRQGQTGLWRLGISGDLPIVVLRIADLKDTPLLEQTLEAHSLWRGKGLTADLVILNEEPSGYFKEMHERIGAVLRTSEAHDLVDKPGGVFVRRSLHMSDDDRNLLLAAARVVLVGSRGSLANQIDVVEWARPATIARRGGHGRAAPVIEPPGAQFFNGIGGFSADGREYVVTSSDAPPTPWSNVIANPQFGFLVTDSGGGFTWAGNSQTNRLTPWSNDPVSDPPGEVIYLRDELTGEFWSPTPLPARPSGHVEVRHGQGYTTFRHHTGEMDEELTLFAPVADPVKIWILKLRNTGRATRRISAVFYVEWALGVDREQSAMHVVTEEDRETGALFARNAFRKDFGSAMAFLDVNRRPRTLTGDRAEFLGRNGSIESPAALARDSLAGRIGAGLDPCGAARTSVTLAPGDETTIVFVMGETSDVEAARELCRRFREPAAAVAALDEVVAHWDARLGAIQVETPDRALDLMLNRWSLYQATACRLWGRSAFYQSGGAYGFRDQLQDVAALVYSTPADAREHLLRAASRQFIEGDVQHWWHPPDGAGVRTRFSDDFLWLPFVVHHYVSKTGDTAVLDEQISFLESPPLTAEQHEVYGRPTPSDYRASLYEHCVRALDHGWRLGEHSLPLMGTGDWNDGMNKVGEQGKGESVWVAWFQSVCLEGFAAVAKARGDGRAEEFLARADQLRRAVETSAWDGQWYLRAFFDDGAPLGSSKGDECQIDSISQSWSVIAGGDPERSRTAMRHVGERLVRDRDRLILLLAPPFDKGSLEPGYIKGYAPGVRENGGQYTHAAIWTAQATALLGQGTEAMRLFDLINPVRRADTRDEVDRYKVEPYVIPADVYGQPPHVGRGGWTWYTGSAAWFYRVGLETILGFDLCGDRLRFCPRVPKEWPGFTIHYRRGGSRYTIQVSNPCGVESGVKSVRVDGAEAPDGEARLVDDGGDHHIDVVMG